MFWVVARGLLYSCYGLLVVSTLLWCCYGVLSGCQGIAIQLLWSSACPHVAITFLRLSGWLTWHCYVVANVYFTEVKACSHQE